MSVNPSPTGGSSPGASDAGSSPAPGGAPTGASFGVGPDLEVQALLAFQQRQAAAMLKKLYDYLDGNLGSRAELASCVPALQQAVESYRVGQFQQASTQAFVAFRSIWLLRAAQPDLPEP